jgi:RimJ/RimL family protein N-acetyltransferase
VRRNVASIRVLHRCGFTPVETGDEERAGEVLLRLG